MISDDNIIKEIRSMLDEHETMICRDQLVITASKILDFIMEIPHFVNKYDNIKKVFILKAKEFMIYDNYPELVEKCKKILEMYESKETIHIKLDYEHS